MVNLLWDIQHIRYHGGTCNFKLNLKRLGLVNVCRLSCSGSSDFSDMGHCNHLAGRGAIYLAVSELSPFFWLPIK
jgi:hypothetical protein